MFSARDEKKFYSVKDAADQVGVSTHTLRLWERNGKINPIRNEKNHRIYTQEQVDKLIRIQQGKDVTKEVYKEIVKNKKTVEPKSVWKSIGRTYAMTSVFTIGFLSLLIFKQGLLEGTTTKSKQIKEEAEKAYQEDRKEILDEQVLGVRDLPANFELGINVPLRIGGNVVIDEGLNVNGGNGAVRGISTPAINFIEDAVLAGLQDIDETTKASLENELELGGDLEGFLNDVTITDGSITGDMWEDDLSYSGTLNITGTLEIDGDAITVSADEINALDGGIDADELDSLDSTAFLRSNTTDSFTSGTLSMSDATFLDLSAIVHNDSGLQGFRLPQATSLTALSSGEGFLAYDSDDDQLKIFNGTSWANVSGSATSLQDAYIAGNSIELSAGEGDIRFYTDGGDEALFIDEDTGRVGIGTTSPDKALVINQGDLVVGNQSGGGDYRLYLTNSRDENHISVAGWWMIFQGAANEGFIFENSLGVDRFTISSFGDVYSNINGGSFGMGDASPDAHLEISANGTTGGKVLAISSDDNNDGDLFTFSESGTLGIGTTSPQALLHLAANTSSLAQLNFTDSGGTDVSSPNEGDIWYNGTNLYFRDSSQNVDLLSGGDGAMPTVIVAASDSQDTSIADYVASGANDEVTIEAAIAALPASGGRVLLLEGNYVINEASGDTNNDGGIGITKSNVIIQGQGAGTVLTAASGGYANQWGVFYIGDGGITTVNNVTIKDLKTVGLNGTGILDRGITIDGGGGGYVNNLKIENCVFQDHTYAVLAQYSKYLVIDSSDFYSNFLGARIYLGNSYTRVTNNSFRETSGTAGLEMNGLFGGVIADNTFSDNTTGIYQLGNSNQITGNNFANNTNYDINSSSDYYASVSGNHFYNSQASTMVRFYRTNQAMFSNNYVKSQKSGATLVEMSGDVSLDNNRIMNNYFVGSSATNIINIADANTTDVVISGNEYAGTYTTKIADSGTNTMYREPHRFEIDANGDVALTVTQSGAADILNLFDDTEEVFTVLDGGNVGIGTTNPLAFLDIKANTTGAAQLNLTSSSGTDVSSPNEGDIWYNGTNLYFRDSSQNIDLLAGGSVWEENGSDIYFASGNVGIGLSDPTFVLDIVSDDTTGALGITADSLTTGIGALLSYDGLTSGRGLKIESSSSALGAGTLLDLQTSGTYTNIAAITGNLISASRNVTYNNTGGGVTFDSSSGTTAYRSEDITFSHTVNVGNDSILIVAYNAYETGSTQAIDAITYNGDSLTRLTSNCGGNCYHYNDIWYIVNPDTGTHDINITLPAGADDDYQSVVAVSFYNIDTSDPFDDIQTGTGTSLSVTSEVGDLVIDFMGTGSNTGSPGSGQTLVAEQDYNSGWQSGMRISSEVAAGASTTMSWNSIAGGTFQSYVAVELNAGADNPLYISNPVANLSSNCTETLGTCNDSSNILALNQQFTDATGAVLKITGSGTGDFINVFDGSTEVFTIEDGGNVGIGTTNPGHKLEVSKSIAATTGPEGSIITNLINSSTDAAGNNINEVGLGFGRNDAIRQAIVGGTYGLDYLDFYVSGAFSAPAMRLDYAGSVGIGTTNPGKKLEVYGANATLRLNDDGTDFVDIQVEADGDFRIVPNSATQSSNLVEYDGDSNWDFISDERLKTGIEDAENMLDKVMGLQVKRYNYIEGDNRDYKEIGLIAQEVEEFFPELVGSSTHPLIEGEAKTLGYTTFGVLSIKAIQELKLEKDLEISDLNNRVDTINELLGLTVNEDSSDSSEPSENEPLAGISGLVEEMLQVYDEFKDFAESLGFTKTTDDEGNDLLAIESDLTVTGNTTLSDVKITGSLTAGLIEIDTVDNNVNVLGASCFNDETDSHNKELCELQALNIQSEKSGNVDFFEGEILLEPDGTLSLDKLIANQIQIDEEGKTIGIGVIEAQNTSSKIDSRAIKEDSKVFITPKDSTDNQVLYLGDIEEEEWFEVKIDSDIEEDIEFNWWIIN